MFREVFNGDFWGFIGGSDDFEGLPRDGGLNEFFRGFLGVSGEAFKETSRMI